MFEHQLPGLRLHFSAGFSDRDVEIGSFLAWRHRLLGSRLQGSKIHASKRQCLLSSFSLKGVAPAQNSRERQVSSCLSPEPMRTGSLPGEWEDGAGAARAI